LIQFVNAKGWDAEIYYAFVIAAYFVQILFLLQYRKQYDISFGKSVLIISIVYPVGYILCVTIAWIESGFTRWGVMNIVRLYAFLPLITVPLAKLLKMPVWKVTDFMAPGLALESAVAHAACPFEGCCHGYTCEWGVWNPNTGTTLFPIQWLECFVAFLIFLGLVRYTKVSGKKGTGRVFFWLLISFGSTRFLLEFLRDNHKVIGGISNLALYAAFMTIVGLVGLWVLSHLDEKARFEAEKRKKFAKKK
jgi:prolipoprotein diacylglyceryltransferase